MHRHDDALELLTTKGNQDAAAYDRIAAFDGIGEDAVHGHGQRDITKKRHKECLHQGGEAGIPAEPRRPDFRYLRGTEDRFKVAS